jgi:hypothetical protein
MNKNVWNFMAIFIVIFLLAMILIENGRKELEPIGGYTAENTVIPDEQILIDTSLKKNRKEWFPIPITSIERNFTKEGKYAITLENGIFFYTNKKHKMTDTICWINDDGNLKFSDENKIIDGNNLY